MCMINMARSGHAADEFYCSDGRVCMYVCMYVCMHYASLSLSLRPSPVLVEYVM